MTAKPPERPARAVPRFMKSKRRLSPVVQAEVDSQFKADDRQYLLAYYFPAKPNIVEALNVAVHENFYRGLEGYLRDRP
jgi:hypothetical protein